MLSAQAGRFGWDALSEMRRIQGEMNKLFGGLEFPGIAQPYPPVNLWVGNGSVIVTAELPGIKRDDIDLTVRADTLTIKGERMPEIKDDEVAWHRRERRHGAFSRTVELPFRVDPDKVEARFHDGLLEVEMGRPTADMPRKIKISTS